MNILDVAKMANLSKSTVSRVINGHRTVDPELALRVRTAMEKLGYRPSVNRRGPKPKSVQAPGIRTGRIGLVLVGRGRELLEFPYTSRQLAGLSEGAAAQALNLMVIEMPDTYAIPRVLRERDVDGVVIIAADEAAAVAAALRPLPAVILGSCDPRSLGTDQVAPDDDAVGLLAADYLQACGCARIAFVNHSPLHLAFGIRRRTFESRARDHGLAVAIFESAAVRDEALLWESSRLNAELTALRDRILGQNSRPDGFFLPSDQQAAVFQRLMGEAGLAAGRDFVVVSCNRDEPWLSTMVPRPATIDTHPAECGRMAIAQLMRQMQNSSGELATLLVRPKLIGEVCRIDARSKA